MCIFLQYNMSCPIPSSSGSSSSSIDSPISGAPLFPFTGGSGGDSVADHETVSGNPLYNSALGGGRKRRRFRKYNNKKQRTKRRSKARKTKAYKRVMRMSRKRRMTRHKRPSRFGRRNSSSRNNRMYGGSMGLSGLPFPSVNSLTMRDFGDGSGALNGMIGSQSPMSGGNVYKQNSDPSMQIK